MPDALVENIMEAHGGLQCWAMLQKVEADIVSNGMLFDIHELPRDKVAKHVEAGLHEQYLNASNVGPLRHRIRFSSTGIALVAENGTVLRERTGTPAYLENMLRGGKWDMLDKAWFDCCAWWTILTLPFCLTMPGCDVKRIPSIEQGGEEWSGIRVLFPLHMATYSPEHDFYFDKDFLLRRYDYCLDIARFNRFKTAQFTYNFIESAGIKLPAKVRAYKKDGNGVPDYDMLMIGFDISNVSFK